MGSFRADPRPPRSVFFTEGDPESSSWAPASCVTVSPTSCVHRAGDGSQDAHSAAFSGGGTARTPAPLGLTWSQRY